MCWPSPSRRSGSCLGGSEQSILVTMKIWKERKGAIFLAITYNYILMRNYLIIQRALC